MDKLKRIVIKEELVILTGDVEKAVILNQFIYWSERVKDADEYILEEKERALKNNIELNIEPANGWIYKKAEEIASEVMICSPRTAGRKIEELVKAGYLEQRRNPYNKWDRTLQYRVNFIKVIKDLNSLGYALEDYPLYDKIVRDLEQEMLQALKSPNCQNGESICQNDNSISQYGISNRHHGEAIPKITTEITTESNNNPSDQIEFETIDDMINHYSQKLNLPPDRVLSTYDRCKDQYKAGNIEKSFKIYFESALKKEKADYEVNKFIE